MRKAECSKCGGLRNCDICGEHVARYVDGDFRATTLWFILKCRGCDHVFVQIVSSNSEDYENFYEDDDSTGTIYNETVDYWPALSKRSRPDWMMNGWIKAENAESLSVAMRELYGALENDLYILAAIGIRTAYDVASQLLGIDSNMKFEEKLDALVSSGHIGVVDKARLQTVVDAGSASVHRGWRPTASELNTMMDVLEHFIHEAFVAPARKKELDQQAEQVKNSVPPRSKATKSRS